MVGVVGVEGWRSFRMDRKRSESGELMVSAYTDLYKLPEDERIDAIGKMIFSEPANSANKPITFGLCVEDNEKADRYIEKLKKKFPTIRVLYRGPCEVPGIVLVKLAGPPR